MHETRQTDDYLNTPHSQATLAEHARFHREERSLSTVEAETLAFLGVRYDDIRQTSLSFPRFDLPHFHHAIAACFPDWKVAGERDSVSRFDRLATYRQRFEIRPDVFEEYLTDGMRFYNLPDGTRRAVSIDEQIHLGRPDFCVVLIGRHGDAESITSDVEKLDSWMKSHHYLRGQAIRPDGTLLPKHKSMNWNVVSLPPGAREIIKRNTIDLLAQQEIFKTNGIPLNRGVLLHGPPGGGKTLTGKILAEVSEFTFIYATAADAEDTDALRGMFKLARRLKPTILFLEDLDLFAYERSSRAFSGALGEILAQMDGLEENDGLIVVATTNDLEAVEPALRDRPSRFDVVLEIGLPDRDARRRILKMNVETNSIGGDLLDEIAADTEGLSGAQMRELAYLAVQEAIMRGDLDKHGKARPAPKDWMAALERLRVRDKRRVGFDVGGESGRNGRLRIDHVLRT